MAGGVSEASWFEGVGGGGAGGSGRRAARRPAAGREAAGSSRLDLTAINGSSEDTLLVLEAKCRSWACPSCGGAYWARVGARVYPHLAMFKRPKLLTLTIDRKRFESGEAAFDAIQGKGKAGLIRRFLRLFGFKKAFCVLAFHPSAREWPHWHVLVDLDDCGQWVDRARMWEVWRDKWGVGGLDLNLTRDDRTPIQAARYAIGYCQHQAGVVAEWALKRRRLPRAFESYGQLRDAMRGGKDAAPATIDQDEPAERSAVDEASDGGAPQAKRKATSTAEERLGGCGRGASVVRRRCSENGRAVYRFLGRLAITPGHLALAHQLGDVMAIDVIHQSVELASGSNVLKVSVPVIDGDAKKTFEKLERVARDLQQRELAKHAPAVELPGPGALPGAEADSAGGCPGAAVDFVGDGVAPF